LATHYARTEDEIQLINPATQLECPPQIIAEQMIDVVDEVHSNPVIVTRFTPSGSATAFGRRTAWLWLF
jgi:hypothetical protein